MAKQHSDLFNKIITFDNIYYAYKKAAKGKRSKPAVVEFEWCLESELLQLQQELSEQNYQPGPYHSFYINDPKRRLVSAAPFRDRVVHHALCRIIEPLFEKTFIATSYANRVGKGNHSALKQSQNYSRQYTFVLQCDIKQFLPSIDHEILIQILAKKLADAPIMALIKKILMGGQGIFNEVDDIVFYPGDDLLSATRPRGLPIGNLTSQLWANVYLNELDQFVKRTLRCRAYLRYMDDFLLFSNDKKQLWQWKGMIEENLNHLRLSMHKRSSTVYPVNTGIPFLGFRVYPTHIRLKRRNGVAFSNRLKKNYQAYQSGQLTREMLDARIQGWVAHASHGNTWSLRKSLLSKPLPQKLKPLNKNETVTNFLPHL